MASSGNVTDEVIREYIDTQDMPKPDDDLRCVIQVDLQSGFQPTEDPTGFSRFVLQFQLYLDMSG